LNQNAIEPLLGAAYPLAAQKEWRKLNDTYLAILNIDPKNYTANLRLGQSYLLGQDYQSAKAYLEKARQAFPGQYEPNLSLGWTYYYLGRVSDARELFINALMLAPNDSLATQGYNLVR
jgi:Tfp pilus assembly protein PilF